MPGHREPKYSPDVDSREPTWIVRYADLLWRVVVCIHVSGIGGFWIAGRLDRMPFRSVRLETAMHLGGLWGLGTLFLCPVLATLLICLHSTRRSALNLVFLTWLVEAVEMIAAMPLVQ